jgi:hypothetical protein
MADLARYLTARACEDLELRYFRDVDGREVDFVVTDRRKPVLVVEAKLDDVAVDPALLRTLV